MNKHITRFIALSTFSVAALAASVPNTFTSGTPAVASQVNANFTAVVNAATALETKAAAMETKLTALEAKVAALENVNSAITADDVVGSYKMVTLESATAGNTTNRLFASSSGSTTVSLTFTKTSDTGGTFTYSASVKSTGYVGQTNGCDMGGNCTSGGYAETRNEDGGDNGSGTWALGDGNTIVVTPPESAPLTVYFSKRGQIGFAMEVESVSNVGVSGRSFSLNMLIRNG
ncbi:MAG: hypothetical protein Q8Q73_13165 [Stagnimonas sp.]|nr:hypothetical protein [Stagnimonas sp.]